MQLSHVQDLQHQTTSFLSECGNTSGRSKELLVDIELPKLNRHVHQFFIFNFLGIKYQSSTVAFDFISFT